MNQLTRLLYSVGIVLGIVVMVIWAFPKVNNGISIVFLTIMGVENLVLIELMIKKNKKKTEVLNRDDFY